MSDFVIYCRAVRCFHTKSGFGTIVEDAIRFADVQSAEAARAMPSFFMNAQCCKIMAEADAVAMLQHDDSLKDNALRTFSWNL